MTDKPHLSVTNIRQERGIEPDNSGNLVPTMTIHFTTPSGTPTNVKLPMNYYTPENAAAAIAHHAAQVEGVHALDGQELIPPPPEQLTEG